MEALTQYLERALFICGLVYFITDSAIFSPVRMLLARMYLPVIAGIYCGACVGFWVGVLSSQLFPPLLRYDLASLASWGLGPTGAAIGHAIITGFAGSAVGALWGKLYGNTAHIDELQELIEAHEPAQESQNE